MTSRTKVRVWLLFITLVVLLALPSVALAKGMGMDAPPVTPSTGALVLDMALMVAITAYLKNLFSISGRPVMAVAFGVGVVLWGVPLISAAYPAIGFYLDSFFTFLKAWLGAMGSVDLVNGIGANLATARAKK